MNPILDTESLCAKANVAARIAGDFLQNYRAAVITSVGKDIKITADAEAHTLILKMLLQTGIPVLSEEDTEHNFGMPLCWVVDPLDGSFNFLRGIPNCAVSIALMENDQPILGAVYDFNRQDMYTGIVNEGAWLNGVPMRVSDVQEKSEAVMMTGFPSFTDYSTDALKEYISLVQGYKKVRLIGSAALSLAYVASGRADAYYERDIKMWDVAAGLALVRAAGGSYEMGGIGVEGKCTVLAYNGGQHAQ